MTLPPAPPSAVPPAPQAPAMPGAPTVTLNLKHYQDRADEVKEEAASRGGGISWDRPKNICYITAGDPHKPEVGAWRCVRLFGPYNERGLLERLVYKHWNIPGYKWPLPSLNTWPQLDIPDPIDGVLRELKAREIDFDNRMWSSPKVMVNGIKRLWDPRTPNIVTGEWDPSEHDKDGKGPIAVRPHVIELTQGLWNWIIGQLATMLAQPTPMNPCTAEYGFDFFFTKTVKETSQGTQTRYENPGFLYQPGPVVADPALLAQITANMVDLDLAFPNPPQETIDKLHDIANKMRSHFQLITAGPMTTHPGQLEPPAPAMAPPPVAQPPAAAAPAAISIAELTIWFHHPSMGVVEYTNPEIDGALTTSPNLWDESCVMAKDSTEWVKPEALGFVRLAEPEAAVLNEAAAQPAAPAAAPPPPAAPVAPTEAVAPPVATAAPAEGKIWVHHGGSVVEKTITEARALLAADPALQGMPLNDQEGGWKPVAALLPEEPATSPPIIPPPAATDFKHPAVEKAFGVTKGQYDGKIVDPMTRPVEVRIKGDNSAKVPSDREFCYGLDHDPRRRAAESRTEQGAECLMCDVEPSCRLERIQRDPAFYQSIGWVVDGHMVTLPSVSTPET